MLIRRLQNKITNYNEITNIGLYITRARKAKHMGKYKIINMVELDIYTSRRGEFYGFTIRIFVSL